ncbi:hypothetical protein DCAR_0104117 [Daucus carota subsp. sativus]|uniref:Uncharacterized protein n=1 Tax=Daucus carota subsp. sativus TaxID=79200 RepID=A0AAF1ALI8_DAUCS|nr:PREDICTED: uncharacterized protein LOC108223699 [Daucus carota subsp. sativus]WOG84932.1 hypothetical protein DCAR_0104117 [Daucus carota subsp. sativus]
MPTHVRAQSSPDLPDSREQYDDAALEVVVANVKLLLKLIEDHKEACKKGQNDRRRMLRVAGMMTVLDNVKDRFQKCQSFGNKRPVAKLLTRCNTDIRVSPPRDRRAGEGIIDDDKAKLRKDLHACLVARKSLESMCSSLGKEKEIMAAELARKNYELSEVEQHINDLRAQNRSLLQKVQEFAGDRGDEKGGKGKGKVEGNVGDLQARNKALSEQLLKSVEGYRLMKRKLKSTQEENLVMHESIGGMLEKVGAGLEHVRVLKQQIESKSDDDKVVCYKEGTAEIEHVLECLESMVSKHVKRKQ